MLRTRGVVDHGTDINEDFPGNCDAQIAGWMGFHSEKKISSTDDGVFGSTSQP